MIGDCRVLFATVVPMFLESGLQSPSGFITVGFSTGTRDPIHYTRLQLTSTGWPITPSNGKKNTIIERACTPWVVHIKEALPIQKSPMDALLNIDRGLEILVCWSTTMKGHMEHPKEVRHC